MQVVLDESRELLRAERGVLICVTHHGFVCANAGVDASNAAPGDRRRSSCSRVDPDASARALRARLHELTGAAPAVVITDSFGRAWRHGQVDVAIGAAGIAPLDDWRGRTDSAGRELRATWIALADEIAGAADLARAQGLAPAGRASCAASTAASSPRDDGPGAAALLRPPARTCSATSGRPSASARTAARWSRHALRSI